MQKIQFIIFISVFILMTATMMFGTSNQQFFLLKCLPFMIAFLPKKQSKKQ